VHRALVENTRIYLPRLHIKLGIIKKNSEGEGFVYLRQNFPHISEAKITGDIFVGAQVKQLFQDPDFKTKLNADERRGWNAFKNACSYFWEK